MKKAKITVEFTIDFEDELSVMKFQRELMYAIVKHTTAICDVNIKYDTLTIID